jgi:hypothetical protein
METEYKQCAFVRGYSHPNCKLNHIIAKLRGDTVYAWEFCSSTKKVRDGLDKSHFHDPERARFCPFYTDNPEEVEKLLSEENRPVLETIVTIFAGKDRYFK